MVGHWNSPSIAESTKAWLEMDRTYIAFSDNQCYESGMKIKATSSVLFWSALVTYAILQSETEIGSAGLLAGDRNV